MRIEMTQGHETLANIPTVLIQTQLSERLSKLKREVVEAVASSAETNQLLNPFVMEWIKHLPFNGFFGAEIIQPTLKPGLSELLPSPLEPSGADLVKRPRTHQALLEAEKIMI